MANEPKTPGQVAYEAHAYALVKETGIGTYTWWRSLPEHEMKVWEATAGEVRHQLGCQNRVDELISAHVIRDVGMIEDIRKVMHEWRTIDPDFSEGGYYDCDAIKAIAAILDPDEPTPEAAGACAEDAAAEPSKSPPPAKR